MRRWLDPIFLTTAGVVITADQITKRLIHEALGPGSPQHAIEVVGEYVRLVYTTNTGAAFGLFQGRTSILALVAVVAVPILLYANATFTRPTLLSRLCMGMLLGGAVGNLIDRWRLGHVVDFIDVGVGSLRFWSFNVADSSFVVGIVILAIFLYLTDSLPEKTDSEYATK